MSGVAIFRLIRSVLPGARLWITFTPVRWAHRFPADSTRTTSYVIAIVRMTAFNPSRRELNRVLKVRAWRDGQEVECKELSDLGADRLGSHGRAGMVGPLETLQLDLQVVLFESTPQSPREAVTSVREITIEAQAARGRRRQMFGVDAFPPSS